MSIYTKTGDSGETSLLGGRRVCKDCMEMEVIGEVDELNASLGVITSLLSDKQVVNRIKKIQNDLFVIGSNIAAVQTELVNIPKLELESVHGLETWIDQMDSELEELRNFILPGGGEAAAQAFLARAICRRAERKLVALRKKYLPDGRQVDMDGVVAEYMNRLSDLLFVLARWLNHKDGVRDVVWKKA